MDPDFVERVEPASKENHKNMARMDTDLHGFSRISSDITEHQQSLVNVAFRIVGDKDLARDVVQDVYLAFLETPAAYDGTASLKTYLYRMTINKCIDLRRRRGRFSRMLEAISWERHGYPKDTYEIKDLTRRLLAGIAPEFRVPLVLAEVDGMSYEEIGEIMHLSINTVRTRIFRCREKLKKKLVSLGYPL